MSDTDYGPDGLTDEQRARFAEADRQVEIDLYRGIGELADELHHHGHTPAPYNKEGGGNTWWRCNAPSCRKWSNFLDSHGYGENARLWWQ